MRKLDPTATTRPCTKCGIAKPFDEFPKRTGFAYGVYPRCWICAREDALIRAATPEFKEKRRAYAAAKPTGLRRTRAKERLSKFNLSACDLTRLRLRANDRCEICHADFAGKWYIDHNHATGKVRGLLCKGCNTGIGHLADSVDRLVSAAEYVALHA